jgi:AcrR family transcriptional regulator
VGRPKEHDEKTRLALLASAERLVAEGGPDALSLRAVAEAAGTTTRAVYSLFGSKDALVASLAQRAFEIIEQAMLALPLTADPAADFVNVGLKAFRGFVRAHPSLYRIAFQRILPGLQEAPSLVEARSRIFALLLARAQRVADAGLLNKKSPHEAAVEFNAMCEGLANAELRGATLPILPHGKEARAWRGALQTVVRGFSVTKTEGD